jgi:hypothetical protein
MSQDRDIVYTVVVLPRSIPRHDAGMGETPMQHYVLVLAAAGRRIAWLTETYGAPGITCSAGWQTWKG